MKEFNGEICKRIYINNNGKKKTYKVYRLIAQTFIPNIYNKPEVNHIDGNKGNNSVDNLEWCTREENMKHAVENNLHKALSDDYHPGSKYSNKQIKHVCKLLEKGKLRIPEISNKTGVSYTIVKRIRAKKYKPKEYIYSKYDFSNYKSYGKRWNKSNKLS